VTFQLPLHVEPAADESLISWFLRLGTRLDISTQTLARQAFGIDDSSNGSHWWFRPHPWKLKRISDKTGVDLQRLRGMTLHPWMPAYRDDEAPERFSHRRFRMMAPTWLTFPWGLCFQCLRSDAHPHVRLSWTIGWMAACAQHATLLITHCARCRTTLRAPRVSRARPFTPLACTVCGLSVCYEQRPAHPSVIRLQNALLRGKRDGVTELEGMGSFSWREVVALADVLIGMFWTDPPLSRKRSLNGIFRQAFDVGLPGPYQIRYSALALFAWLTADWPGSFGAQVGRGLLAQWLSGNRTCTYKTLRPHLGQTWADPLHPGHQVIEPEIRERLRELI
jgi:hypothetical protein